MPLAPGARLGPYEVLAPLGADGMGEVYRARDTKLDRAVAIKILPESFGMAPEQARGKAVDKRADLWAFGCVLCEMLTGRQPFEGAEVTDVLARVIEREPERNGRELFFRSGIRMMAAPIQTGVTFATGAPRVLFEGQYAPPYDVTADGAFLMVRDEEPPERSQLSGAELV